MRYFDLQYTVYDDLFVPNGSIPRLNDKYIRQVSGAFHFAKLANRNLKEIPEAVVYEGEADPFSNLRVLGESVAKLYGVRFADMMDRMAMVKSEMAKRGWDWNGKFQAWIDSGGQSYNLVTRDPDALNKG